MKTAAFLFSFLFFSGLARATNYYFSSSIGNDARTIIDAQNPSTPWKTLEKLNLVFNNFNPGDSILFRRGDVFYGSIVISRSGSENAPIVFGGYGDGAKPVISGLSDITDWVLAGNGIWKGNLSAGTTAVNMVLINDQVTGMGRYPNATEPNKGYLMIDATSNNNQITDNDIIFSTNWTGADLVIRKNRWVIDRNIITGNTANTISYTSGSAYGAENNFGYFIQNHVSTLDQNGEWYFNPAEQKLNVYYGASNPASARIQASTVDKLVSIQGQSFISFDNLSFQGSNLKTFEIKSSQVILLTNCDILYAGYDAIDIENSAAITLNNNSILYTNNNAITGNGTSHSLITNNIIRHTGIFPGMGKNGDGGYEAIMIEGKGNTYQYNEIDSVGYIAINFSGDSTLIKNNFINHFGLIKDDGGGIYTWNGHSNPYTYTDCRIIGNILLNGTGAGEGTNSPAYFPMHGIYMDDKTNNVKIEGNTVANCGLSGIYIHNANAIDVKSNTLFNNKKQISHIHDENAPNNPIRNLHVQDNILFSKSSNQYVSSLESISNDIQNFGTFNDNYYCRPLDESLIFYTSYENAGKVSKSIDLEEWKTSYYNGDNSKTTPLQVELYTVNSLSTTNKYTNGNFSFDINGLYTSSVLNNAVASWDNTDKINGGSLKITHNTITAVTNKSYVVISAGGVEAGKNYILRLSVLNTQQNKIIGAYLRQTGAPYQDISTRIYKSTTTAISSLEFLFTATISEANASIGIELPEQISPVYIDNIGLYEAEISAIDPESFIRFEYNATTQSKTVSLESPYIDMRSNWYTSEITLEPYSSAILMKPVGLILLPFNFLDFKVVQGNNNETNFLWRTENETSINYFEIQGSKDGKEYSAISSKIFRNDDVHQYSFLQNQFSPDINYYRIKAVDQNGRNIYSKIIKLHSRKATTAELRPNPANNKLVITLNSSHYNKGYITIRSISGTLLRVYQIHSGQSIFETDISFLPIGSYIATIISDSSRVDHLFLKN